MYKQHCSYLFEQLSFSIVFFRATVRPEVDPVQEKSTENKITTPVPLNEESLQLQSIISDISVITDPRLLIPAKAVKRVKLETNESEEPVANTDNDK